MVWSIKIIFQINRKTVKSVSFLNMKETLKVINNSKLMAQMHQVIFLNNFNHRKKGFNTIGYGI